MCLIRVVATYKRMPSPALGASLVRVLCLVSLTTSNTTET